MVAESEAARAIESPVARLALLIEEGRIAHLATSDALKHEFLWVVKAVGKNEQAMKLRTAQLLLRCKSRDVSEVGYSSWTAFVKEMSPWRGSRTRDYLRLVESRPYGPAGKPAGFRPRFALDVIKEAASKNEIDLAVATRAPREIGSAATPEDQIAWLLSATLATLPSGRRPSMDTLSGEEMARVRKARDLAEILIGWDAPLRVIDDFLLDCHARKLTGDQIRDMALAIPPKPERLGKTVPEWKDDPTVSLVGPWEEPTDIHDAVDKLRAMEALLDFRHVLLGIAYVLIRDCGLWRCVRGCKSPYGPAGKPAGFRPRFALEELCLAHLDVGQRSFQRYAQDGLALLSHPRLQKEISAGRLTVDRAMFAVDHASGIEPALRSWLALVRRLGRTEMHRAAREERDHDERLREAYAPALAMVREVEGKVRPATEIGTDGTAAAVSAFDTTAERIAAHLRKKGTTGRLQVALRDDANRRSARSEPDSIRVRRGLLAAADYLPYGPAGEPAGFRPRYALANVELPKLHGPRKTVMRDRYICQNPRCRRRTLRVHHHHLVERQHGGCDEPWNTITTCPACHLRLIHRKRMSVDRFDDWLVWTWPDGEAVLMHSPLEVT